MADDWWLVTGDWCWWLVAGYWLLSALQQKISW
jgi:hypothetical protein